MDKQQKVERKESVEDKDKRVKTEATGEEGERKLYSSYPRKVSLVSALWIA